MIWYKPCVKIIAQTAGDDKIEPHGTYVGRFFDVVDPIASSMSLRSSSEILGWTAGVSKIKTNQQIDQMNPMAPGQEKQKQFIK